MQRLRVIRPSDRVADTASGTMRREAAISSANVGAEKIWVGYAELPPGMISAAHHHGRAESGIYMISGHARFVTDEGVLDADEGDVIFVPPHVVHIEANRSATEPIRMIVSRSTQETLVFNVETPPGWRERVSA